jgi:hypothetical protein
MDKPPAPATAATDQAYLAQLFANPAPVAASTPADRPTTEQTVKPERTTERKTSKHHDIYQQSLESLAYLGSLLIAAGLWAAGAYFTLRFIETLGVDFMSLGIFAWAIPAIISAIELSLWPRAGRGWQRVLVFSLVLAFDVGSSFAGVVSVGAGKTFALFNGVTLPKSGAGLWVIAIGAGLVFAFIPEKIGRWAVRELRTVWK